ncbi:MAG: 3-deoxy-manno-octulosonate cytidylyltransferase [Candidatus Melainabacteria bacterium]|nr:3-deoxy-manno-octulosonate cytidylyltransferase [Candidatus Melainabacteria bacterium]
MNVLAVIPARYASTRFPGKPLVDIGGKPMIQHVWERVMQVAEVARVLVATDDERIAQAVQAFGGEVCLTSPAHVSGTDRVWEVAAQYPDYNAILNVQGDEPFISPACLGQAIAALARQAEADMVTAVCPLNLQVPLDRSHWQDANVVKAVLSDSGQALYFSRSPIPAVREAADLDRVGVPVYRHLGLYLYRRAALERFTQLPPHPLELAERLEQLRALAAGMRIATILLAEAPVGIDTPDDLERVLAQLPALMQEKMIPVL